MAMFVDLRAAFDLVNRRVLLRSMREREIREGLVKKMKELLKEARSRVRVGGGLKKGFWTARQGVRQAQHCLIY